MENSFTWQKIILVDDDSFLNRIHKIILDKIGYKGTVLDFKNGFEAEKFIYQNIETGFFQENDFNLIILDINMPILNGWGFLDSFHKLDTLKRDKFKIIVSSSSINPEDIMKAMSYDL